MTRKITVMALVLLSISFGISCQVDGENDKKPQVEEPENEPEEFERITTDPNKTFVHPGLLHGREDFERISEKLEANAEPWVSGWEKLTANNHASVNYKPNPVVTLIRGGNSREEPRPDNYATAFNDAAAAYQIAIRWKITGDDAYADKAVEILNAWASTCTGISGNSNTRLASGLYGYQFANAAEIMRDYEGWEQTDFETFKQWLLDIFYPLSKDFLERHNNTCISHYWANWDLCNIANIMAIGVLTDSAEIYNYAIDYLMEGDGNGRWTHAIYYVHNDQLAQLQESGRDQGHALLCIGLLGTIAEMAFHQGDDLYGYGDNMLLKAAEYSAKFNYANLSVPFEPYNNCNDANHTQISEHGKGNKRPIWERIFNHYVKEKGLSSTYVEMAARIHRPEGGGGDYGPNSGGFDDLGLGTLMYTLED